MPRQQKRSAQRAAAKKKTRKSPMNADAATTPAILDAKKRVKAEDLSDRDVRGVVLAAAVTDGSATRQRITEDEVWYLGKSRQVRQVRRMVRNDRGTLTVDYECDCEDFRAEGRNGCMHIVAERIIGGELIVVGQVSARRAKAACARRRPTRKRHAADGRPITSAQRDARVGLAAELPRLVLSLVKARQKQHREVPIVDGEGNVISIAHRPPTPAVTKAAALLFKIALGKTAEEMQAEYQRLIDEGYLRLKDPPCANTISHWMNDPVVTPVLRDFIRMTAYAFRRREIGAIVDSSKVSQMRTAHYRRVAYEGDERPRADWMRCHALVGVETMVVMAVEFGGNRGLGTTHDSQYVRPLVSEAIKQFGLHYLLADKAYFGRPNIEWLWNEAHIRAVIPVKKNIEREQGERREVFHPYWDLIRWYDESQRDFHEVYRLRPKIEGFFSLLKRVAAEQMWSRGRLNKALRTYEPMKDGPCVAWVNEALCKFIYMNLRTTNTLQHEAGVTIDYLVPERCFPPPVEPLLHAA